MSFGGAKRPAIAASVGAPAIRARGVVVRSRDPGGRALAWARTLDWWLVAGLTLLTAALTAALAITIGKGQLLGFGDTTSHLDIARRVLDGRQSGFRQLGVHWLPLFQTLELPFVAIAPLFHSGAAGVIVSFSASLVTAFFVYRLVRLVGCSRSIAFAVFALFAASPSFLYIGVVPMQPAMIMAVSTINIYYLTRWAIEPDSTRLLLASGLALTVTTLAHFDTWALIPLELGVVAIVSYGRWQRRTRAVSTVVVWSLAGLYGFAFFLAMNVLIFGRPTAFLGSGVGSGQGAGAPPPPFQTLGRALGAYPWAAYDIAGPALVVAGLLGLALYVWRARAKPAHLVALLLFYPLLFYVANAAIGYNYFDPSSNIEAFVHVRYGATIFPALIFFAVAGIRWRIPVLVAALAVIVGAAAMIRSDSVATWLDARHENGAAFVREIGPTARATGNQIDRLGGSVYMPLVSEYNDRFEFLSKAPLSSFIDSTSSEWRLLRRDPARARQLGVKWLLGVDFGDQLQIMQPVIDVLDARLCTLRTFGDTQPNVAIFTLTGACPFGEKPGPLPIYRGPG